MHKITLADGTQIENLELNGNNFISDEIIEDSIFKNNLDIVKIFDGENEAIYEDMKLVQNIVANNQSWFILAEKSLEEKRRERDLKGIEQLRLEQALSNAELFEMMLTLTGGGL